MRTTLLTLVALMAVALASAAVTPKDFHSSHGHKKHQKTTEREEAVAEELGPVKEPVKVRAPPPPHGVSTLRPFVHPIPSHPPPHAEVVPHHHHRAQMTGPSPVIHPIPSHPPPVDHTGMQHPKKHAKKEE